jgi:magnesium transporter
MNFEHMPELHWLHGYPFALALMASTTSVMVLWFWKAGWLRRRRERGGRRRRL